MLISVRGWSIPIQFDKKKKKKKFRYMTSLFENDNWVIEWFMYAYSIPQDDLNSLTLPIKWNTYKLPNMIYCIQTLKTGLEKMDTQELDS